MKRVFLSLLVVSVVMVSFSSCEKDEPKGKTISKIEGIIDIDGSLDDSSIYAYVENSVDKETTIHEVISSAKIDNKKFKLQLKTPSDKVLEKVISTLPKGLTADNKKAKVAGISKFVVKNNKEELGELMCVKETPIISNDNRQVVEKNLIFFIYSNEKVGVTGTYNESNNGNQKITYKLDLYKGWNIIDLHFISTIETTIKENDITSTTTSVSQQITSLSSIPADYKWVLDKNSDEYRLPKFN